MELGVDGCVVWWDAWAAVGTTLGVLIALFSPAVRKYFMKKRVSAVFAASFSQRIFVARQAVKNFQELYPLSKQEDGIYTARVLLQNDEAARERAIGLIENVEELTKMDVDLSKFPEVDTLLAADVARSILFSGDVMLLIPAIRGRDNGVTEETWARYWESAALVMKRAEDTLDHASAGCDKALRRMSIKRWGLLR
jgi:hypothetical protein